VGDWIETYRGSVYRWEVDHNEHFTVAYYFTRLADAGLGMLEALGLGAGYAEREGRACVTVDCHVRYLRELRAGDIMHVESGVIAVEPEALLLGHRLIDSDNGELCTTAEQRVHHVDLRSHKAIAFYAEQRRAAETRRAAWDGQRREVRPRPPTLEGFRDSARDTIKPSDLDALGQIGLHNYILRFSAANMHAVASLGMTPRYMREQRRGFSTFEFQLALTARLHAGDVVGVRSALLHVGNTSMRFLHVMTNARTGESVASLEQFGVHLDMDTRRPTPLPPALREKATSILVAT